MAYKPIEVGYLKLKAFLGTTLGSELDEWSQAFAEELAAKLASYVQDTLAKRPAAGNAQRLFQATDTGQLFHDTGTKWDPLVGPGIGAYVRKTFSKAEAETGVEPSPTRLAFVSVGPTTGNEFFPGSVTVEGQIIPNTGKNLSFLVQPGQRWVAKVESTAMTLLL